MSSHAGALTVRSAWTRVGVVLAVVLVADQLVKELVTSSLERGDERSVIGASVKIVNVRNTGVAFGQLQDGGAILTIIIAVAVTALLVFFMRHARERWMWLPTGMLLGGALGNVIDRIREGAVVDFIKLPHWPAFNVADMTITFGVIILLVVMDRGDATRRSG